MPEPMLVLHGLSKTFRRRFGRGPGARLQAVRGLDLTVYRGDIFGFLGPNGAGKSTTIRMALGLIHPTAGAVTIAGHDLAAERRQALRKVGAFVEAPSFYPYLSGRKNLEIFSSLSGGVPPGAIGETLRRVGLAGREDDKVRVYSHGMRQRLGIAACLLPRPELLILDEPTDGLDPHGVRDVRALVKQLAREDGLTVFLSSHFLGEVENLCNRIAILDRGRIVLQGALAELERRYRRFHIETGHPEPTARMLRERFHLEPQPGKDGRAGLLVALNGLRPEEINAALSRAGWAPRSLAPEERWLDRLFLELTRSREGPARAPGGGGGASA